MRHTKLILVWLITFNVNSFDVETLNAQLASEYTSIVFRDFEEDLSQKTGNCLLHDRKGYIWFGTIYGLNRYDGNSIRSYFAVVGDSLSLGSNSITCMEEDNNGDLWIGTLGGIYKYNRKKDSFTSFRYDESFNNNSFLESVDDIFIDSLNTVWAVTNTPCFYDSLTGTFTRIKPPHNHQNKFNNRFGFLHEDIDGQVWFGYWRELFQLNILTKEFEKVKYYTGEKANLGSTGWHFKRLIHDKAGTFWLATEEAGLFSFDPKNPQATFIQYRHEPGNSESISSDRVTDLFFDENGILWISLLSSASRNLGGVDLFNPEEGVFYHHNLLEGPDSRINSDDIISITEDRHKRLWFGSYDFGFQVIDPHHTKFDLFPDLRDPYGTHANEVKDFTVDETGTIFLALADEKGIVCFDPEKGRLSINMPYENKCKIEIPSSISIEQDIEGNFWSGTWGIGLYILDKEDCSLKHLTAENSALESNIICHINRDKDGRMILSTFDGGLSIYDFKDDSWKTYLHDENDTNSLKHNSLFTSYTDKEGDIWIGTCGFGLDRMKYENGEVVFSHFFPDYTGKDTTRFSDYVVQSIFEDSFGNLWIGSSNGLNLMNREKENFQVFYMRHGLPSNSIQAISEDNLGNLWISTLRGLCKMNIKTKEIRSYNLQDGLQGEEFNRGCVLKSPKGELFFGGNNGFNRVRPSKVVDNPYAPEVVLTDFLIFNESVVLGENPMIDSSIDEIKELTINYSQNVFSFEFSALNFTHPSLNKYAFMLEGFEKAWNYVGDRRTATYTNLDPGNYTFKVKAANNDGIWNEEGISINLFVKPPFWQTLFFRTLFVLCVVAALIVFYYVRVIQVKRRNIMLEKNIEQRTSEINKKNKELEEQAKALSETNTLLEERQQKVEEQAEELQTQKEDLIMKNEQMEELNAMKDKFFSIIGHDLKNPIGNIMGFAELLLHNGESFDKEKRILFYKSIFDSTEKTFQLLKNLLDWARSQSQNIQLEPEKFNLSEEIRNEITLLSELLKDKNIFLKNRPKNKDFHVYADKNMVNTILRNLLTNAIKFSHNDGTIKIDSKYLDTNFLQVTIADNGVGMTESVFESLFRIDKAISSPGTAGETGTGLGLILCKEFVEKNGGKIWVESKVGKGSTFYFTLPSEKIIDIKNI